MFKKTVIELPIWSFVRIKSPVLVLLHAERWIDTHGKIHRHILVIFVYEHTKNEHALVLRNAKQYKTRLTTKLAHNELQCKVTAVEGPVRSLARVLQNFTSSPLFPERLLHPLSPHSFRTGYSFPRVSQKDWLSSAEIRHGVPTNSLDG